MAWAGEYGEDDDEFDSTPIEEVLEVTREDQEMLTEAHKALRREIKSIRRALKNLVRQFYAYADAQESTAPEWSDVSSVVDSFNGDFQTSVDTSTKQEDRQDDAFASKEKEETSRTLPDAGHVRQGIKADSRRPRSYSQSNDHEEKLNGINESEYHRRTRANSNPPTVIEPRSNLTDFGPSDHRSKRPLRRLKRSSTQPVMMVTVKQGPEFIASLPDDNSPTERSLSRNSEVLSAVEDNATLLLEDLDSNQFNNTYPGASPQRGDNIKRSAQSRTRKHIGEMGRSKAQLQFDRSNLLQNSNSLVEPRGFGTNDGSNGVIPPELEPQLTEFPPDITDRFQRPPSLQRRFTQEEIRFAGSQLRIPSTRHLRRSDSQSVISESNPHHKNKTDEPPSVPPPPPPDDLNAYLICAEDQLGDLPEFPNSFQALPRRLSSSEISAIGGREKRSKQIPRVRKLIRSASQSHVTVAEVAI